MFEFDCDPPTGSDFVVLWDFPACLIFNAVDHDVRTRNNGRQQFGEPLRDRERVHFPIFANLGIRRFLRRVNDRFRDVEIGLFKRARDPNLV